MTANSHESAFDFARQAFQPLTDAFKSIQDTAQLPQAARDFVKRAASEAAERAETVHAGAGRLTAAIETAVADQVTEAANISRQVQQALLDDAKAFFAGVEKLASAQSLGEAFQIQSDMARTGADVAVTRARATADYLGERLATGAKAAQENFAKVASPNKAA